MVTVVYFAVWHTCVGAVCDARLQECEWASPLITALFHTSAWPSGVLSYTMDGFESLNIMELVFAFLIITTAAVSLRINLSLI